MEEHEVTSKGLNSQHIKQLLGKNNITFTKTISLSAEES